jgi:hypothetical protein
MRPRIARRRAEEKPERARRPRIALRRAEEKRGDMLLRPGATTK